MSMMTSEREAFEKWLPEVDDLWDRHLAKHDGQYIASSTHIRWEGWQARAALTQPAQAVDAERVLAALGHVRVPSTRCLARVAETPPELRPPGPHNLPIWCCLPRGHDGQHRHNGGGLYHSIPFRDKDEVVIGEPLPDHCEKCRHIWPCDDAKALIRVLSGEKAGPVGDGWLPIETAPKDGRELILLLTPSRFPQVAWSNTWWTAGFSVECKPTHWMRLESLPASPTPNKEG